MAEYKQIRQHPNYRSTRAHSVEPDFEPALLADTPETVLDRQTSTRRNSIAANGSGPMSQEITDHPSYHGVINMKGAELKLRQNGGNSFLTRYSKSNQMYVLTVLNYKEGESFCRDFKIKFKRENDHSTYEIIGTQLEFNDISRLLDFYQYNPLSSIISSVGNFVTLGESFKE